MEEIKYGTFSVTLGSIGRVTEVNQEGELNSVWACVDVLDRDQFDGTIWWKGDESGDTETCLLEMEKRLTQLVTSPQDTEEEVSLQYSQVSRDIELSEVALTSAAQRTLKVSVYAGETRDNEQDKLVGTIEIGLDQVIFQSVVAETKELTKPESEEELPSFQIEITVECSNQLADFALGGRIVTLNAFTLVNIPTEWKIELAEDEDPIAAVEDPAKNIATYQLTAEIPGKDNESVELGPGRLTYTPGVASEEEEPPAGEWSVAWGDANLYRFLRMNDVQRFQAAIESNQGVLFCIERIYQDKGMKEPEIWKSSARIVFSNLTLPGIVISESSAAVEQGIYPSQEELQAQLETAEKDEKKHVQEKLDKLEETLSLAAGHAAVLLSANTTFRAQARMNKEIVEREPTPPPRLPPIEELIPPREPLSEYPPRDAIKDLQNDVKRIAVSLLSEYEKLFLTPESVESAAELSREERKKRMIIHLSSEGIYLQFKEAIKAKVVQVIKDKFPQAPTGDITSEKGCVFYSELYVTLLEQANLALNDLFQNTDQISAFVSPIPPDTIEGIELKKQQLLHKARECEARGDFAKASECHLERIGFADENARTLQKYDPSVWYDYALFAFRQRDTELAAKCLERCLATDAGFIPGIQAYGALLCELGEFSRAETMLKNAVKDEGEFEESKSALSELSHGLLAMYFTLGGVDKSGNMTKCELMVSKNRSCDERPSRSSSCINVAAYLIDLKLERLTECALKLAEKNMEPEGNLSMVQRVVKRLVQSKLYMLRGQQNEANTFAREAIEIDSSVADAWFLLAQGQNMEGDSAGAIESLGHAIEHRENLDENFLLPLHLQLGTLYLAANKPDQARDVYLQECGPVRYASTWLGVGRACLRLEDWDGAERALSEANTLDNSNPEVWGYLALFCLSVSPPHRKQALLSLEQATINGLQNPTLLRELGNALVASDNLEMAEKMFRRSLAIQESSLARRQLADVLLSRNFAEAALKEYHTYLNTSENIDDRRDLLDKCAKLLSTLGRAEEATEYREMAAAQSVNE